MPLYNPPITSTLGSSIGSVQLGSPVAVTGLVDVLSLSITIAVTSKVLVTAPTRYSATLAGVASCILTVDGVTQDTASITLTLAASGATTLNTEITLAPGSHTIKIRGSVTLGTLTFAATGTAIYAQLD